MKPSQEGFMFQTVASISLGYNQPKTEITSCFSNQELLVYELL